MVDRLERLTDLVLVLLRDERPKPLREIAAEVPGYPAEGEARRQAFERDKRTLRDGGVEVTALPIEGREQVGYLIRPEDF
jgi:predicted DNA-binding transcriptional regulator YafY